jgi:hypothetical protein
MMEVASMIGVTVDEMEVMPYYKVIEQYQYAVTQMKKKK